MGCILYRCYYQTDHVMRFLLRREHRQVLCQRPGGRWNSPSMKVLILLVESGIVYTVILVSSYSIILC